MNCCGLEVVHHVQGRIRVRWSFIGQKKISSAYLEAFLSNVEYIEKVRINPIVSSIVIFYNPSVEMSLEKLEVLFSQALLENENWPITQEDTSPNSLILAIYGFCGFFLKFFPLSIQTFTACMLSLPMWAKGIWTLFSKGLKVEVLEGSALAFSFFRGDYSSTVLTAFLLKTADFIESHSEKTSSKLLCKLVKNPVNVVRVRKNGLEDMIGFQKLKIGDEVVCEAGDIIPVDGEIIEGEGMLNVASITGESLPVWACVGKKVISGSIVEEGKIVIKAEKVGIDTMLLRVQRFLVEAAIQEGTKEKYWKQVADNLVPLIFVLGTGVYLFTGSLTRASAVFMVDYSCALKSSYPVGIRAAIYVSGKKGILVKGADALEKMADIDILVFDKTGTLTENSLEIAQIIPLERGLSKRELIALAAAVEKHYSHPIAKAIVEQAKIWDVCLPETTQVDFVVAHGVSAIVNGHRYLLGSRHFLEDDEKIDCSLGKKFSAKGKTILYLARDSQLIGVLLLQDKIRQEASQTLYELKKQGIKRFVLLTGDQKEAALHLKQALPELDEVYVELKPEDKAQIIKKLQQEGKVGFVGDGVNDAPAMLCADISICMSTGSDLAKEVADMVFLNDNLNGLLKVRSVALRLKEIFKNSVALSFGLNSVYLGLAMGGVFSPTMAGLMHNLTTVGIIGYHAGGILGCKDTEV